MHVVNERHSDVRVMRASTTLAEAGFAVSVVDLVVKRAAPLEENVGNVCMKHLIVPNWHSARRFELWFFIITVKIFILSIFRLIQEHADIYHASELTALPACFIVSRLLRKPLIFEIYDLQFPVPYTGVAFWRRMGPYLYALLLPHCAEVIVTSPLHAQEIRKRYSVPAITLVRNIPRYQVVKKSDRLRKHLGLSPNTRIAIYQGNISSDRGLDILIHAASFLERDTAIVIMGKAKQATLTHLEALISKEGMTDRVKILPPVPYEELLDWTASADIGLTVLPPDFSLNTQTLLPNKLFEYLMAGLPVLSSELDAVADVIKTYDVGQIVHSHTPSDVGRAINTMLADRTALTRMHQNALHVVQENLCWEKEKEQLILLYQKVGALIST
jgi:glycosyltransferase involved in cell wall biosynthesis